MIETFAYDLIGGGTCRQRAQLAGVYGNPAGGAW